MNIEKVLSDLNAQVGSDELAEALGVNHRSVILLIEKYENVNILKKNGKPKREVVQTKGRPGYKYILNAGHVFSLILLAKNSDKSVKAKLTSIKVYSATKKKVIDALVEAA